MPLQGLRGRGRFFQQPHLALERGDQPSELVPGKLAVAGTPFDGHIEQVGGTLDSSPSGAARSIGPGSAGKRCPGTKAVATGACRAAELSDKVGHGLADRLRVDPVLLVVLLLNDPAALGLRSEEHTSEL